MAAAPPKVPNMPQAQVMKGGSREQTMDVLRKYAKPLEVYIGIAIGVAIVYCKQIPESIKEQANSLLGRLLLFILAVLIADMYSWIYGLLFVVLVSLLIAQAPRSNQMREAFQDKQITKKIPKDHRLWFVEEVFHENPEMIQDELVSTTAIQDNTGSSSRGSSK
jgi:Ca2+/Na+ antiporter